MNLIIGQYYLVITPYFVVGKLQSYDSLGMTLCDAAVVYSADYNYARSIDGISQTVMGVEPEEWYPVPGRGEVSIVFSANEPISIYPMAHAAWINSKPRPLMESL